MASPESPEDPGQVTHLLARVREGDVHASDELMRAVYVELRAVARAVFSGCGGGHTLQPTALVHEAWIKLHGNLGPVEDRRHFFVLAGKAMRQVVADHARARNTRKRGGERERVAFDTSLGAGNAPTHDSAVDLVDLDDCLRRLAERNTRHAEVAELRLFSGLSIDETAAALELSPRSVDSDWAMAKAWLQRELSAPR